MRRCHLARYCTAYCLIATWVWICSLSALPARGQSSVESSQSNWVTELEPGIRIIGRENPFQSIFNAHSFLVHPDGEHLLFVSHQQFLKWHIGSKEIRSKTDLKVPFETLQISPNGRFIVCSQRSTIPPPQPSPEGFVQVAQKISIDHV